MQLITHDPSQNEMPLTAKKNRQYRLLVIDLCNPFSLGGAAIALSLINLLKNNISDLAITLMASRDRDLRAYKSDYTLEGVDFLPHIWYREKESKARTLLYSSLPTLLTAISTLVSLALRKLRIRYVDTFGKYDVIIDLNSDAINEHYGSVYPLFTLLNITFATFSGKPVVVAPCSIGTLKNPFLKRFAAFALNRTRFIIVREMISIANLRLLGVSKPKIRFGADLAFLFDPDDPENTKKLLTEIGVEAQNRPLLGITPSQIIHYYAFGDQNESREERRRKYVNLIAEITDFMIERIGGTVLLIPHSYSDKDSLASYLDVDDRVACKDIYQSVKNKKHAKPVYVKYRADQIKGLIGACDMFIACRMHSSIASTSQFVPTIVLAYGTKFEGVIGRLINQQGQLVDVSADYRTLVQQLKSKIVSTWKERHFIEATLRAELPPVRRSAQSTLFVVKRLLEDQQKKQEK